MPNPSAFSTPLLFRGRRRLHLQFAAARSSARDAAPIGEMARTERRPGHALLFVEGLIKSRRELMYRLFNYDYMVVS